MCPAECMNANIALAALPNIRELACCDCGEGAVGMECRMRKKKIFAACGGGIDCNVTVGSAHYLVYQHGSPGMAMVIVCAIHWEGSTH